jgi:hypothetical protein
MLGTLKEQDNKRRCRATSETNGNETRKAKKTIREIA